MKTFKFFVEEKNKEIPCVIIHQGEHSISKSDIKEAWGEGNEWVHSEADHKKHDKALAKISNDANSHIGKTSGIVQKEMEQRHSFSRMVPNSVSLDEMNAVKKYTNHSRTLNDTLYNSHVDKKPLDGYYTNKIKDLDSAVTRYKLHTPLTVFSGVKFHPEKEASKTPSRQVHLPAYTSTSLDLPVARQFASAHAPNPDDHESDRTEHHVLAIHLPKDHHGLYIGKMSKHRGEKEFLLPRHTRLRISSKPPIIATHPTLKGHTVHVWDAHVVRRNKDENF
jgi:hypothetical protein